MNLSRAPLPPGLGGFAAAFPGPLATHAEAEPIALLSFASSGDMRFGDPRRAENRERFALASGLDPGCLRGLELAHTRRVLFPARNEDPALLAGELGGADGLVLRDPDLAATVTVADCMPIWILDRGSGAFGLLHSGWRGTGILETAVRGIAESSGSDPASMAVILGPAIGACCYAVDEARAAEFSAEFGESSVSRRGESVFLDLREANLSLARRLGIGHVLSIDACTCCDPRLGSFRRQGGDRFTRMLAICGPSPRAPDIDTRGQAT